MPRPVEALGTPAADFGLDPNTLKAITALWIAQQREVTTPFGDESMRPAIAAGQAVGVRCGVVPSVGQVVVFLREGALRIHRMVADGGEWLLMWGDANPLPDEPCDEREVVGVVVSVEDQGVMGPVPPGPRSLWRRALLFALVGRSGHGRAPVAARVRLAHAALRHARRFWRAPTRLEGGRS
jgi:Peptidase S24-like